MFVDEKSRFKRSELSISDHRNLPTMNRASLSRPRPARQRCLVLRCTHRQVNSITSRRFNSAAIFGRHHAWPRGAHAEQPKAFLRAANSVEFPLPELRSADAAMWERVREAHPALASLSDEELNATCTSYIEAKPSITDVLFKTPVGPVFALNIIAAATGFSWCDVPFVNSDSLACAQQAARMAGQ